MLRSDDFVDISTAIRKMRCSSCNAEFKNGFMAFDLEAKDDRTFEVLLCPSCMEQKQKDEENETHC